MAQKLHPITLQRPHLSLRIESNEFSIGYTDALTQSTVRGFDIRNVDEHTIISLVQNIAEIYEEGWPNYNAMLRYWSGVIAGILTRQTVGVVE